MVVCLFFLEMPPQTSFIFVLLGACRGGLAEKAPLGSCATGGLALIQSSTSQIPSIASCIFFHVHRTGDQTNICRNTGTSHPPSSQHTLRWAAWRFLDFLYFACAFPGFRNAKVLGILISPPTMCARSRSPPLTFYFSPVRAPYAHTDNAIL
jgi:hypothetical protein